MRSAEDKKEILRKVDELTKSGSFIGDALSSVGLAKSQYYKWKKANKQPKAKRSYKKRVHNKKAFIQDIPIHQPSSPERVMCIIGSSSEIADIIRGIK